MIFLNHIFLATCAFIVPTIALTLAFTNSFDGIQSGAPFDLTWQGDGTPVNLILLAGLDAVSLVDVSPIATNVDSPYTITPPSDIPAGTYAIRIEQSGQTALSPIFAISAAGMSTIITPTPSTATPAPTLVAPGPSATATPTIGDSGTLLSPPAITASPTYVDSAVLFSALFNTASESRVVASPSKSPVVIVVSGTPTSYAKGAIVPSTLPSYPGSSPPPLPPPVSGSPLPPPARVGTASGTAFPYLTRAANRTYCNSTALAARMSTSTTTLPCPSASGSVSAVGTGVVAGGVVSSPTSPSPGVKVASGAEREVGMRIGTGIVGWAVRLSLLAAAVGVVA
ncbi:hypothetical protein MMC30_002122 [Trapelia coarctata]|nr:hypothetical protein [Trapelia coarctata]